MSEQNEMPDAATAAEAAEAGATEQAPPPPPQTPKERKVASRARRGQRRPSTPEERREQKKAKAAARSRWRASRKARRRAAGVAGEPTPPAEKPETNPQTRLGTVVSTKADKTITVRIDIARRHKRYQKIVRSSWTLHAHDERNEAGEGDLVRVMECRPMSRTKRWRLTDVLERAK